MKKYRRLSVAVLATCLTFGMVAAPSALAKSSSSPKAKTTAVRITTKSLNTRLTKTNKSLTSTRKSLSTLSKNLGALSARMKTSEGNLALLLGAAPQLVSGLQTLATAVQTQIAPGLLQLKDALEKQVSPALTQLGDAVQNQIPAAIKDNVTKLAGSNEYGVVLPTLGGTPITGAAPLTSSNIPDDANQAVLTGTVTVPLGPSAAATAVNLMAAIRSGESDGTGAANPAAWAGLVSMRVADKTPNVTVGGGGPGGMPITSAQNMPAPTSGLPVYPINTKSPLVDATPNPLAFPTGTGQNIDLTSNLATGFNPITLATDATPGGGWAVVEYTVRFVDLTASASDLTA